MLSHTILMLCTHTTKCRWPWCVQCQAFLFEWRHVKQPSSVFWWVQYSRSSSAFGTILLLKRNLVHPNLRRCWLAVSEWLLRDPQQLLINPQKKWKMKTLSNFIVQALADMIVKVNRERRVLVKIVAKDTRSARVCSRCVYCSRLSPRWYECLNRTSIRADSPYKRL